MIINEKLLDDYLYYKPGDTISFRYQGGGYITGSTKSVFFTMFTDKRLSKVRRATITGNIQLRQNNAYPLSTTSLQNGDFTIESSLFDNTIVFNIIHNTAYTNATNNSPVGIEVWGTITFS